MLEDHLEKVAGLAARFAGSFMAADWGRLAGLWHDLGKYHPDFQRRLLGSGEKVEHAGLGAALAFSKDPRRGLALAFAIAAHHSGLPNLLSRDETDLTPLRERLRRNESILKSTRPLIPRQLLEWELPALPPWLQQADRATLRSFELWTRFLFSALVDADFLATEEFYTPGRRRGLQTAFADIADLSRCLDHYLDRLVAELSPERRTSPVNQRRAEVLAACRRAADAPPGFFSLTVPTGGGKTLAAMAFALRHAERHGLRRVIAAIPFTSIIEQNAGIYAEALGPENVIEHHSALDPESAREVAPERELRRRLAAENWDAPVIVTTNVQLFESLFANRPGRCRKLHSVARSVLLLDEAQTLPPDLLLPVLDGLRELVEHYGSSVVFSTATQPALARRESLPQGIENVREIVPSPIDLAQALKRVRVRWPATDGPPTGYGEIAAALTRHRQVLAVVHLRRDARRLAEMLPDDGRIHLSALMCPAHRLGVLAEVRRLLAAGAVCRVVSTQLVEAGVDVDFPVVFRALGGLDSVAQAAGRCNREGKLPGLGEVVVFRAETSPPPGLPRKGLQVAESLLREQGEALDLGNPETFDTYFRSLYQATSLDSRGVQDARADLNFATVAKRFRLIEDGYTEPVVVSYGIAARRLDELRRDGPSRDRLRSLQPFTVQVPAKALARLSAAGAVESVAESVHAVADLFHGLYNQTYGLALDEEPSIDPEASVI
jgi:CRISPR-associated endonuclease/helicase Cas3